MRWFFELDSVLPQIFIFGTAAHGRTRRFRALLAYRAVNQIDPVEKINDMHGQPIIEILAFGQLHNLK